jgi:hypothetical protein
MDAEDMLDTLRREFKAGPHVEFHGMYPVNDDALVSDKEHVQMVVQGIWRLTGYQFT